MSQHPTTTEDIAYVAWAESNMDGYADYVERENQRAFAAWVEDQCEGHESLRGDSMGAEVFCDGTCRPVEERDENAYLEYLEGQLPED